MVFAFFGVVFLVAATLLIMNAFRDNLVFFFTPSDIAVKHITADQYIRIGGLVAEDSVTQQDETIHFTITDLSAELPARFIGVPPALFREGQGVVAEGRLEAGIFYADKLLAKHDENYMPPEVAEALKKSGKWRDEGMQTP